MATEDHRISFLVHFFNVVDIWSQPGLLQAGIDTQRGNIAELVVDLIGNIAITIDAFLQRVSDVGQRIFFSTSQALV